MPKGGSKKKKGNQNNGATWTAADHEARNYERSQKKVSQYQRSQRLTHNTDEKKERTKLKLHITKISRQIEQLRQRLQQWDDVTEAAIKKKREEEEERQRQLALEPPKKKKKRPGPETWKLRGAARPAWEVYDFDVRYEDPHLKAHEDAKARAKRSRNLLLTAKGQFASQTEVPQPECRTFLSLLMQLGLLHEQANQIKSARSTFLEILELDSPTNPITCARGHLMRIYLKANRPASAQRLWERFPNDHNVWIRYSQALVEYQKYLKNTNNKEEEQEQESPPSSSEEEQAIKALLHAIRCNMYCAYYLAFGTEVFDNVMEYVEEIEDATEEEPLELAIEYCNSEQRQYWEETDGAIEWLRSHLLKEEDGKDIIVRDDCWLSEDELDWKELLQDMEEAAQVAQAKEEEEGRETNEDDLEEVDVLMYAGMFRTAMEMVQEQYKLKSS